MRVVFNGQDGDTFSVSPHVALVLETVTPAMLTFVENDLARTRAQRAYQSVCADPTGPHADGYARYITSAIGDQKPKK